MKIVSISIAPSDYVAIAPCQHFTRMRALPCEVVECYDAESVYEHGESADVIFLPTLGSSWPPFWNEIAAYIESLPAFVAIFAADPHRTVWHWGGRSIRFDALIPCMFTPYKEHEAELGYDCKHILWSPWCMDVEDHNIEKDIDVLFWGNPGRPHYPFRNFILRELTRYSSLEGVRGQLIVNTLTLGGDSYSYVRLPYRNAGYWGSGLYPLLERAKICCAGSTYIQIPNPKYIENAACGSLTLTNDFSDREALGFEHGKNIWITDEDSFIEDLTFLLENEGLVTEMSTNARTLIAERHTVEIRARELYAFLQEVVL